MKKSVSIVLFFFSFMFVTGCSLNNVTVDDGLQKFFAQNKIKGTFAIMDNSHEMFTVCDLPRYKDSTFSVGGSFDILNSLIAIETGRLKDGNSVIKKTSDSSNAIFLKDAFRQNDSVAFQTIASSIGKDTMQYWLDSLHYGEAKIFSNDEQFWTNDSLKLTPDEQLGFIEKLYFSTLPFQKRTQQIVQQMLLQQNNTAYSFAYKTSWNVNSKGQNIGWALGWIEENKHIYFFVINAQSSSPSISSDALSKTLKSILAYEGFFHGKK